MKTNSEKEEEKKGVFFVRGSEGRSQWLLSTSAFQFRLRRTGEHVVEERVTIPVILALTCSRFLLRPRGGVHRWCLDGRSDRRRGFLPCLLGDLLRVAPIVRFQIIPGRAVVVGVVGVLVGDLGEVRTQRCRCTLLESNRRASHVLLRFIAVVTDLFLQLGFCL